MACTRAVIEALTVMAGGMRSSAFAERIASSRCPHELRLCVLETATTLGLGFGLRLRLRLGLGLGLGVGELPKVSYALEACQTDRHER